ncbi:MAG: enoyl-CoA hydratase/isomerase family protein [Pseudomonadales bacterium]|nr:enoyl-CoA hydratase/isomerase family protein [Pseudomonadales bacterium]
MNDAALLFEVRGPVAWLTLNRVKAMNAINLEMITLFEKYLPEIAADEKIRVLVVTGAGTAFCAGADLKEVLESADLPPGEDDFLDRVAANLLAVLRDFPKPVIAALNGITLAGGLETAMSCDIVVACDEAKIGDAHANFGVYPGGGGAAILPRLVPQNVAKYLLFTGKTLSAREMQTYGFVNEVVSAEKLIEATQNLAEEIAQKSPVALRRMKAVANASLDKSRDAALEHEQVMLRKHMRSFDMFEGLKAFAEKRKPLFRGR